MSDALLARLRCPNTHQLLRPEPTEVGETDGGWLAPQYDQPQTAAAARQWLEQAGLKDVEVLKAGHLVGRGVKGM